MSRPQAVWRIGGFLLLVPLSLFGDSGTGGKTPVEVQVEITEVDNTRASRLGIEWVDKVGVSEKLAGSLASLGSFERVSPLHADLHFLMEEGAAELLANPNLITDSGTTATFHAGGQIPYITSASLGTTHVQFKPYGVAMSIEPNVLKNGMIRMKINTSVSAPDQANGVLLGGNAVPALFERIVTSNVTVLPGSTMTLAGLVQTQKNEVMRGVPVLGKIPLLGALFRWRRTQYRRTTVIIFVTPRLVDL